MKWIRFCSAVVATLGLTTASHADLSALFSHGSQKSCGCDSACQPTCCTPTITRPCNVSVHTYQRKCSDVKPPCCNTCCAPESCCAVSSGCGSKKSCLLDSLLHKHDKGSCCESSACCETAPSCAAPAAGCCNADPSCAAPAAGCCNAAPSCAAPAGGCCNADPSCAAPAAGCCNAAPSCAAPADACCDNGGSCGCQPKKKCGLLSGLFGKHHSGGDCCDTGCGDTGCCDTGCCQKQCCADPCEIARLIYCSQTACYADDRKDAIDELGDNYDCACNPEIMVAMIYALNDADEEVRAEAADEIGDQLSDNRCCCSQEVITALTCALRDCDRKVRKEAEQALEACGYCIVDGCCNTCCDTGCNTCCDSGCANGCDAGGSSADPTPAPVPAEEEAAPAPAPPEAYYPSRIRARQTSYRAKPRTGLAAIADLFDEQY